MFHVVSCMCVCVRVFVNVNLQELASHKHRDNVKPIPLIHLANNDPLCRALRALSLSRCVCFCLCLCLSVCLSFATALGDVLLTFSHSTPPHPLHRYRYRYRYLCLATARGSTATPITSLRVGGGCVWQSARAPVQTILGTSACTCP